MGGRDESEWVSGWVLGILELGNGGGRCDSCGRWVEWEGRRRRGGLCEVRGARSEEVRGRSGLGGVGRDRRGRAKACGRV